METLAIPGRPHSERLLAWLRAQEHVEQAYDLDMDIAVLKARAALRDLTAIPALTELAADAWTHRRTAGEAAIDLIIQHEGERAILEAFGAKAMEALAFQQQRSMAARLLGVRLLHRAGGDITAALGDASVIVAEHAAALLSSESGAEQALWERVHKRAQGHVWALVVLQRRGADVRKEWLGLSSPRVELPGIPTEVREAIVRNYAPGERETDPRFLLEAASLEPRPEPDEVELLGRAARALSAAGLQPQPPISAGELYQQGSGTYFSIRTLRGEVRVSTLGPFVSGDEAVVKVLRDAGFRHIDDELGSLTFERLNVYFFGKRDWLSVSDLLFYWQD